MGKIHVGRGDGRVLDMESGKVYSSIFFAGLDLHQTPKEIEFVCEHYKPQSDSGRKLEWLSQFMAEHPGSDFPVYPTVHYERVKKPVVPKKFRKNGKLDYNSMEFINFFYKIMETYLTEEDDSVLVSIYELKDKVEEIARRTRPLWKTTTTALSRHVITNKSLYERVFNLQVGYVYSKVAKREVYEFVFEQVSGSADIIRSKGYDYKMDAVGSIEEADLRVQSRPVMRMTDRMVFASIHKAAKLTGINYAYIRGNCLGDIDRIHQHNSELTFRFVKYVD